MASFRIFICYAHEDRRLARGVAKVLKKMKHIPVWDKHITPGTPFTNAIKTMIACSHVFMPIITKNSQARPWVHQETGYALALNIPVLPLAFSGVPSEMISQLQAVKVRSDLSDLRKRLDKTDLQLLVLPPPEPPRAIVEVADSPEERTSMMAHHARRVVEMGAFANITPSAVSPSRDGTGARPRRRIFGRLRQKGALSSLCIPDADLGDPIWDRREGCCKRSPYYRQLQRAERQALEEHVRGAGCDLIIDPTIAYDKNGPEARIARLETLLRALSDLQKAQVPNVRVITSLRANEGSLTLVGNWFAAESMAPRLGEGYRQTIFTWHAPTVLSRAKEFDAEFSGLCTEAGRPGSRLVGPGLGDVIQHLGSMIEDLKSNPPQGRSLASPGEP